MTVFKTLQKILASDTSGVWYQGRKTLDPNFDLSYVGKGNDQEGPGFYFTSELKDALGYAYPDGLILKVEFDPGNLQLVPDSGEIPREKFVELILRAPNQADTLTNWDEDPETASEIVIEQLLKRDPKDAFQQVWYDFYRDRPADYCNAMVQLGYWGHEASWTKAPLRHLIVYTSSVIGIRDSVPYRDMRG